MSKNTEKVCETNFTYYLKEIWRKKFLILIISLILALLLGGYRCINLFKNNNSIDDKDIYNAKLQVYIADSEQRNFDVNHSAALASVINDGDEIRKAAEQFNIDESYEALKKQIIASSPTNKILLLSVKNKDKELAAQIVDYIAKDSSQIYAKLNPKVTITTMGDIYYPGNEIPLSKMNILIQSVKYGILGFVIGIIIIMCLIGLRVLLGHKVITELDVSNAIDLPVFSTINFHKNMNNISESSEESQIWDIERFAVQLSTSKKHSSLAIVSCENNEGKTTVLKKTANYLAKADNKVLVIDCSQDGNGFKAGNNKTIEDLKNDSLDDVICKSNEGPFDVIPTSRNNMTVILSKINYENVLKQCQEKYDYVFVDAGKISESSASLLAASKCNECVMLVKSRHVSYAKLQNAAQQLSYVNANLTGVILNQYLK